jgi:hypothetical protein
MDTVLDVLIALGVAALAAHTTLVFLTFRASTRWGLVGLVLPPVAWIAAFRGRTPQKIVAAVALACLLACAAVVVDGLTELGHAIDIGGTSVGEPRHR